MTTAAMTQARRLLACVAIGCGLAAGSGVSGADLRVEAPSARSRAVPQPRIALVLLAQPAAASSRAALATADRDVLSKRFRDIGFEVWTIGPAARPQLDRDLRDAASRVPDGADVLILALGTSLGGRDDLYVMPADSLGALAAGADGLDTKGLRLGDVLRRLAARRVGELVAVVDECRPLVGERCPLDAAVGASGASILAAERSTAQGGSPLAAQPSLRNALLAATAEDGQALPQSFGLMSSALGGSDLALFVGTRLSASFAFLPAGFFAGVPGECGRIDPEADPAALRGVTLDPLLRACEQAAADYPFARFFAARLGVAREQRAFQRSVASCDDRLPAASYRSSYPAGRFLGVVESFVRDCDRRAQEAREDQRRREEAARAREAERERQEEQRQREAQLRQDEARRQAAERQEEQRRTEEQRRREEQRRQEDQRRQQEAQRQRPQYHYIAGTEPPPRGYGWVALRKGPGRSFDWYRDVQLSEGMLLTVVGSDGPWVNVRLENGRTGWAAAEFVKCCRAQ